MKYPRIVQQIHQIELTTQCNLRCKYCPHPNMLREKVHMDTAVFKDAIGRVYYYAQNGLQGELSFTGIGEPTLHPELIPMLARARQWLPGIPMVFSTNGMPTFTEEIAAACAKHNVGVMISMHRPEVAGLAIELAKKHSVLKAVNTAFATSAFNWAGQVDGWFNSAPETPCEYLRSGWGVILVNGNITTCCLDASEDGVIGDVWTDPNELYLEPFSLCDNCHMSLP